MTTSGEYELACDAMEARVLGGARPSDDPALAAHLGSCLRCFRAASELRDLPRIEGLLRASRGDADPGDGFWETFPGRVADAWEASVRPIVTPSLWSRLTGWLRLPLPAALAG